MQNIGITEIIIIALVVIMLFGAKKIPEFARGVLEARKEFDKNFKEEDKKSEKKINSEN